MSLTSSAMDYILFLESFQTKLFQFGGPIFMILGGMSCILSFTVFIRKNLRKNPCSMYFIALNISDLFFIYIALLFSTLEYGYNFSPTSYNLALCKFLTYTGLLFDVLSGSFLLFASIDRILVTSSNARIRRYSTQRLAKICIIGGSLFWIVFHIHALFFSSIQEVAPGYFICYFQPGIYRVLASYYGVLKLVLEPIILTICGLWAVKNIRNIGRIRAASNSWATRTAGATNQRSTSSKDRQLVLMLLIDIVIYIMFSFPMAILVMYLQITQYQTKDYQQLQYESFLQALGTFGVSIPFCVGLYTKSLMGTIELALDFSKHCYSANNIH